MSNMKELNEKLQKGEQYNSTVSIRAVEENDEYLVVRAIANKFLDASGAPVEDNHGTILTQATLDTSDYMKYNSVVLAHHNSERPVGKTTSLSMKEDGLEVVLEVYKDNDPQIFNQVKRGTLQGLSIGMYIDKSEYSEILDSVIIREARLMEISLVTNPSNPLSFIEAVDMCSLGACSAIRSGSTLKQNRSVDKEAMKAMLKQVLQEEKEEAERVAEEARVIAEKLAEETASADKLEAERVAEEAKVEEERLAEEARLLEEEKAKETDEEKVIREEAERVATEAEKLRLAEEAIVEAERLEAERVAEELRLAEEATPTISFEERLEEAAIAFSNMEEGKTLTSEQVNLLTFIVMNYGDIETAVKQHLEA